MEEVSNSTSSKDSGTPPAPQQKRLHHQNGRVVPPRSSPSPRVMRRQESGAGPAHSTPQAQHLARIICNSLWGQKLTFHPYTSGESPIPFLSLWPDKRTLVDTFTEAELNKRPFELCKLLLATNSFWCLEALLDERALNINCDFGGGCGSLLHLACALGHSEMVQSLVRRSQSNTKVWSTTKDSEGRIAEEVCMKTELRRLLPTHSMFSKKKAIQVQQLRTQNKKDIFELAARTDTFYTLINTLNTFPMFDVNTERNEDGDLLIHVAIKGGLLKLPLLFALLNYYKADLKLRDGAGTTPLALAIKAGKETLVEVLICVLGVDINEGSGSISSTPLHVAVSNSRPRIVSMLLRRGADALKEDGERCIPSFLARKNQELECRQIMSQHLTERTERICRDTVAGTLRVSELYPSDLSLVSSSGCTLLMLAAVNSQELVLRELLKKGDCPLDFRQMKSCDHVDSLNNSLDTSWCETDKDKDHTLKTAVHMAAERGNLTCLDALLNANAHPALMDASCWLPLHYAVDNGYIECVKSILAYPNFLGLTGLKPALDIAQGNNFTEIAAVLQQAQQKRQCELIEPVLFEVAHSGNKDYLFQLLQNGDNVNPLNEANDWPLLLAAGFGYDDMVAQLHQFGGHIARRHRISRSTPLHVAARGGHTKVVKYLLQFCRYRGDGQAALLCVGVMPTGMMEDEEAEFIDINAKNTMGATPLELAASQGHTEVVKLLLERGASTTLPDSNGRLLSCTAFAGTQFLLETHRKQRCRSIIDNLRSHRTLKEFRRCWQGPSDFNLYASNGDNMLMLAAQHAQQEVLKFLLEQAAAMKPTMIISSGESPLLLSSITSSRSEESSDSSHHSRNKSDSHIVLPSSLLLKPYDPDDKDEPHRHTALPTVFRRQRPPARTAREERLTASGGSGPDWVRPWGGSRRSTTTGTSSEEEDVNPITSSPRHPAPSDNDLGEISEPFTNLIRFCNPRDGQTALHRASAASRHQNVALLMRSDAELANVQDLDGNTALHLACNTLHRPTVTTLLNFECVMTTVRNRKSELPEQKCVKSSIKKLVCKVRQSRAGSELGLPDPPNGPPASGISASMEVANEDPPGLRPLGLPRIEEVVTPYSSMVSSNLSFADLNTRLQQMKTEINSMPPPPQENLAN